jgi:hypothetical protein
MPNEETCVSCMAWDEMVATHVFDSIVRDIVWIHVHKNPELSLFHAQYRASFVKIWKLHLHPKKKRQRICYMHVCVYMPLHVCE